MANDTEKLTRTTVRSSIKPTNGPNLAYTSLAVFTTNEESVLPHRFDYTINPNDTLPFVQPAIFNTFGNKLNRRELLFTDLGLNAYPSMSVFATIGRPAPRLPLPVLYDIDTCQILVRGGAFVINFTAYPLKGLPPHVVQFENKSQTPIEIWTWSFGDGEESHERSPYHVYMDNGEYDVTLRSGSNIFGFAHLTKYGYISVGVHLNIVPTSGLAPLRVRFSLDESYLE